MGSPHTLIYLLRHGEVRFAETRRFIGHTDVPLSPHGKEQARAQAARLRSIELAAVFSIDLERARRTAEILAEPHGLVPIVIPALREMAMGRWEGLTLGVDCRPPPLLLPLPRCWRPGAHEGPGKAVRIRRDPVTVIGDETRERHWRRESGRRGE